MGFKNCFGVSSYRLIKGAFHSNLVKQNRPPFSHFKPDQAELRICWEHPAHLEVDKVSEPTLPFSGRKGPYFGYLEPY